MSSRPFTRILVANRGEIAVRIMRTCRERGITPIAVYSDADRFALHVRHADEAYHVGGAPSRESYLVMEGILEAARTSGAQAIHPGFGFLAENAEFAEACADEGFVFIGPSPQAIRDMGDKTAARRLMREAGVPMAPGTIDAVDTIDEAMAAAREIGFPLLVKAAAGGGGKGMRTVNHEADLEDAVRAARNEALNAFGDGRVYVEKLFLSPRHVEIQVLADTHGNVVHLFERECSIQRRHQKVIEEAPSAILTPELREQMGEAALTAARACDYVGAGTVEFLLDEQGQFYFLEMNTRLQVEHPVTEWVTGIDLVAEQIRIAEGEALGYEQEDLSINGHAIECRVYAEDVEAGFLPSPGPILRHVPPSGLGVRVDAGVDQGDEVPIHYDPMISKLSVWGRTRKEAIERSLRALGEYDIAGVPTTIPFCRYVLDHEAFRSGDFSTSFVDEHFDRAALRVDSEVHDEPRAVAAALASGRGRDNGTRQLPNAMPDVTPWRRRRSTR